MGGWDSDLAKVGTAFRPLPLLAVLDFSNCDYDLRVLESTVPVPVTCGVREVEWSGMVFPVCTSNTAVDYLDKSSA